ncbi:MAG TPA: hypothetical protein VM681_02840 [Candidatus Thermoplasmatota archaeon]|nr:hypothetical protein [Candidatus Thermoplasmatota archaeon]
MDSSITAAKLGVKKGMKVWLQGETKEFRAHLAAKLPEGALLVHQPRANVIVHWIQPLEMVELLFPKLAEQVAEDGAVWVVIPNESERERRGMPFFDDEVAAAAQTVGWQPTKTIDFSEKDVGVRFAAKLEKPEKPAKAEPSAKARGGAKPKASKKKAAKARAE